MEREGFTRVTAAPDNPGIVAHPPFLYLGALGVAVVAQWLAPRPMLATPAALVLGLSLIAVGLGIADRKSVV